MKRILIITAFLLANISGLKGQSFSIENEALTWQRLYESELNSKDIVKSLYMSCRFTDIVVIDESFISATLLPIKIKYEKLGYKRMSLPIFISDNDLGPAKAIIQISNGKYLVTVKKMFLSCNNLRDLSEGLLDNIAIKDNQFASVFIQSAAPIYDACLTEAFNFEKVEDIW